MIRIGLIGAGANTRARHIPGLKAIEDVEIVAVCNRRPESTAEAAREFAIPQTFSRWEDIVQHPDIDAVVIGTWPYLHAPITIAALQAGKHVLTEARMAMNAKEAHEMARVAQEHKKQIAQIVPSPFGLNGDQVIRELLKDNFLGQLRTVSAVHFQDSLADPSAPLHWRQDSALSGVNMLTLGIFHETLSRWIPQPIRVQAQVHAFIGSRIDPTNGSRRSVGTPDTVQVLTEYPGGARGSYQFSGVCPFGQQGVITLQGSDGVLVYDLLMDRLRGASRHFGGRPGSIQDLPEITIPREKARGWRVEADFIDSIRNGSPVRFTSFEQGVAYMEFTEAVARSAQSGIRVGLPLTG